MLLFINSRWLCLFVSFVVLCDGSLQPGFSKLQRGHRLDGRVIQSFAELSFLDCVIECLVTQRCKSVNYIKGANFCEINYENKTTAKTNYEDSAGWVYSEKEHWPKDLAGACANSNCQINQTCKHKRYSKDISYKCVLSDCGIPNRTGIILNTTKREDAIGIHRRIHVFCSGKYFQFGSGRLICQSNGEWKYNIVCEEGWTQNEDRVYRLFTDLKTWNEAKDYCESKDAYLVEIETTKENTWIQNNINNTHFLGHVWIGAKYQDIDSKYIWSKSGNEITFNNWATWSPKAMPLGFKCIGVSTANGKWSNFTCVLPLPFICEKNLK